MGRCALAAVEGRALGGAAAECTCLSGAEHEAEVAAEVRAAGSACGDLGWMMVSALVVGFSVGRWACGRVGRRGSVG